MLVFLLDLPCLATATEADAGPVPSSSPSPPPARLSISLPLSALPPLDNNDHPAPVPACPFVDAATEPDAAPPRSFLLDLPCFATATEPDAGPYPLLLPFSSSRSRLSTSLPLSTLPPLHHNDHPCSRPSLLHSYFPGSAARGRSP